MVSYVTWLIGIGLAWWTERWLILPFAVFVGVICGAMAHGIVAGRRSKREAQSLDTKLCVIRTYDGDTDLGVGELRDSNGVTIVYITPNKHITVNEPR